MEFGNYYDAIFKRRSFHRFQGNGRLSEEEKQLIQSAVDAAVPLAPDIRVKIALVPVGETTLSCGAEMALIFYSEQKPMALQNVGFLGEQIDLALQQNGIGTCWFGIGKAKQPHFDGMDAMILMGIGRADPEKFRNEKTVWKRKALSEIWTGDEQAIGEAARFAPSAVNSQPWRVECKDGVLCVSRLTERRGIIPAGAMLRFNRIDMGIFLAILEVCLLHSGKAFERTLFADEGKGEKGPVKFAQYSLADQRDR